MNRAAPFVLAALAVPLVAACAGSLRDYTYPPDFRYVTQREVRTAMDKMAVDLTQLDALLRDVPESGLTEADRQEVVALLTSLQAHAVSLKQPGQMSNHPSLGQSLDAFVGDIASARRAAQLDPPNYYLAGSVTNACIRCHQVPGR